MAKIRYFVFLFFISIIFSPPIWAKTTQSTLIADFQATYQFEFKGINLAMQKISFKKQTRLALADYPFDIDYPLFFHLKSKAEPQGLASAFIDGIDSDDWLTIYQHKLTNLSHHYRTVGSSKKREYFYYYQPKKNLIVNKLNNQSYQANFPSFNKYNLFLALAFDLNRQEKLNINDKFTYSVADEKNSKIRTFTFVGKEIIDNKLGKNEALIFESNDIEGTKIKYWLIKKWHYLPIKAKTTNSKGDSYYYLQDIQFN